MIKLDENRDFGEGSNIGADMATGEYILFLNNDCMLAPDFGEQLRRLLCEGVQRFDALGARSRAVGRSEAPFIRPS